MSEGQKWPEFVGKTGEEAKQGILAAYPNLKVEIMNFKSPATMDYRVDRVRIITDDSGKVMRPPTTG